jgi:aldehyde dehydrogenase (NAD+)
MLEVFLAAGLPDGVLNVVFGGREAGKALVSMMDEGKLQKFAFTGSSAVGREIGAVAGRNLVSPSLELGGKNPLIVMRDANLENAVSGAVWAAFGTGGQRCTSAGNIILDKPIAEQFTRMFLERVKALEIGDPIAYPGVTYGPFMSDRFMNRWLEHLDWGEEDGATRLYGQGRITNDSRPSGFKGDASVGMFGWPIVWGNVRPESKLFQTEVFGPTINLVTVDGIDEAIQTANAAPYGLSSAIYTNNHGWAFRFKENIEAGMSSINNSTTGAEAHLPFGGTKSSGNTSRESGVWVLEAYTRWHAVNDDHAGALQLAQMDTMDMRTAQKVDLSALLG